MIELIIAALLLDYLLGDPRRLPHPVVLMGKIISFLDEKFRRWFKTPLGLYTGGVIMVVFMVGFSYVVTWQIIIWASKIHVYLGWVVHLWLLYTTIAAKCLQQHARAVATPLLSGDVDQARVQLAKIVGRDTENLDEKELTRGTVETVAENTVDGIVAPLFYAFIGGAPLAMAYKAINTMDSMVGYRNQRYIYFGWAAARLDDAANYIPARITGLILLIISPFTPGGFNHTLQTIVRDARKHPSPNSGIPEAAVAGALKVQLGGVNYYRGEKSQRAIMGDNIEELQVKHIYISVKLMYAVTLLSAVLGIGLTILFRGV